jgi:hypothetical protein
MGCQPVFKPMFVFCILPPLPADFDNRLLSLGLDRVGDCQVASYEGTGLIRLQGVHNLMVRVGLFVE